MSLDSLLAQHDPLDDDEAADLARTCRMVEQEPDPWTRATPLHATASAVVVHVPTRRVLLRWHARQQAWLQIGGHADPGEDDPLGVALREGAEETGLPDLRPWPGAGLVHVAVVPVAARGDEPEHEHADLRFVLATDRPDDARAEDAGSPVRWLAVDEALALTSQENLRRTLRRVAGLLDTPPAAG